MQGLKILSIVLSVVVLSAASLHGYAQNVDCRSCHAPDGASGTKDFSAIYAKPLSHHPVGIEYPAGNQGFRTPDGQGVDVTIFDRNGNGQPDDDEIQLFGESGVATIECASCHREHGNTPAPVNAPANSYLRFDNTGSALCTTCHSY